MPAAELDHLFEAIRRTRDPELLATLFERTAPWLLHRARLLLRRANLAEDVRGTACEKCIAYSDG